MGLQQNLVTFSHTEGFGAAVAPCLDLRCIDFCEALQGASRILLDLLGRVLGKAYLAGLMQELPKGAMVVICNAQGSGKTTML